MNKKKKIIYLTGVSGSGKTHVVRELKKDLLVAEFDGLPFDLNRKIFPFGKPRVLHDRELVRKLHEKIPGHFSSLKPIGKLLGPLIKDRIKSECDRRNLPIVVEGCALKDEFWRSSVTKGIQHAFGFAVAEEFLIFHNPPVDVIKSRKDGRGETERPNERKWSEEQIEQQQKKFQKSFNAARMEKRETSTSEETKKVVFELSGLEDRSHGDGGR